VAQLHMYPGHGQSSEQARQVHHGVARSDAVLPPGLIFEFSELV
jgi:hypothetical protein